MRTLALSLLASAALLAPSGASAATILGTFGAALFGATSSTPTIAPDSVFGNLATLVTDSTKDFSVVSPLTAITLPTVTATKGAAVSFTSAFGSYSGTVDSVVNNSAGSIFSLLVITSGTFTPTGVLASYDVTPSSTVFTFGQSGYSGSVTGTVSFSSPAVSSVPEPATWGMMLAGAGLAGAALRRRRVKVAFAA
ncbi:PEPxxWA-CTERM sorting domain-containing protein [Sphingomonas azotifigens]|uniref:PEPxxWA-CTERM sorting domain-containing protein n=1 Tax=Sphingomonas azotifigens TaxID=330920 RepID=UPI000A04B4D6|nr:PEPxxWA-CTERM sorting domain-containing protein [Sphingomonas azotifigens]